METGTDHNVGSRDQARASELRYGVIPELEKQLPRDGYGRATGVRADGRSLS